MTNFEKLKMKIKEVKIICKILDVATESYSVDDHVRALGIKYTEAMSTLLFIADGKRKIILLRRDDRNVDLKKFKQILKANDLRFANEAEVKAFGFEVGLLTPFLLDSSFEIYVDQKTTEMNKVICGSTVLDKAIETTFSEVLKNLSSYQVIDVTIPNPKRQDQASIQRVLSGITPSGKGFHIGNYFGAVKEHIEMQNRIPETFYFIADLHALTTVKNKEVLEANIMSIVLDYLALGLDPKKSIFYRQSAVPGNSQLTVVLANYISYGQMKRMHAFKDKLQKGASVDSVNMGLFNYPILMAADILLYQPDGVPVGEDQRQHVELARDIAESFNHTYKQDIFKMPEPLIKEEKIARVVGTDGERKMSKSLGNTIEIFADPATVKKQIMSSYTDPNRVRATDPGKVEGNPIFLYHDLINDDKAEVADLKERYQQGKVGDVEVKEKLIIAHQRMFGAAQAKRKELENDLDTVRDIMADGAKRAQAVAAETLEKVYETIGLK